MSANSHQARVAILGSGSIGVDLTFKVLASRNLQLAFIVGRNQYSEGLRVAKNAGVETSSDGIDFLKENTRHFDMVFDATSAKAHVSNNDFFKENGIFAIDLTPAKLGTLCVPSINLQGIENTQNVNLITCGGQASIPLAYALAQAVEAIEYLEVVSTISSRSAGIATRENINEYLVTTEYALAKFSGAQHTKAILNINPADPGICMQTTLYARATYKDFRVVEQKLEDMVKKIQSYVPGYQLVLQPIENNGYITLSLTVHGSGDYLPSYAGNLDIINCAAIAVAEHKYASIR
ncbi:acetaldehyde dehydrogenase (acetylating) [Pseudomonas agarici]|uniref:Acetaldehyde dehydrogenase n=1 Tax=Pseudomonas agarici TaxID=46677 RepID=A0A0X1SVP6_PSEAA|nr:acetaldehyde dehydrogenase (acetylating) [Pseudomonas agarici]AMB83995.1 acetaldehyde dehydrogenase (acetylating) [Pseudomonas agarici]NWB91475.1 acetaldehyde dehydrogenase (acetylating) [Pseudomonas agarici]NWC07777.1 acetaldehyde dehydrogenase (acetylating) [Pseudomonas agarici]SEK74116.1 acetaldehyde dehydrogenase [Pseudomonas agarici]